MVNRYEAVTMIMAHIRDNFTAAFFPRWAEWAAAMVLLGIGLMLSIHTDLMVSSVANGYGKGYEFMLNIAGQSLWATMLTVFGSTRLAVLLINGAWRRSPVARAVMAFLSCFFWTQLVLSFQPTFGFAFVMACGWLLTDIVNIMRAARDARTVEDVLARGKGIGLD